MTIISKENFYIPQSFITLSVALFTYKNSWYLDIDVTNCFCNILNTFTSYIKFTIPQTIKSISRFIKSMGKGTIYLNI